jgi:hypothetical protein
MEYLKTFNMKMYLKSNLFSLLFCVLIALTGQGCNKNGSESVEGRVLEYGTNKPIANATVYLMEVKGTFLGPSGSSKIDSTTSDHEGRYKFTYMDNPYVSEIRGKANLYYDNHAYIMGTGKKLKTDLKLDPHAWLRIHLKNVNPVDSADFLSVGLNPTDCAKGFRGMNIDTFMICEKYKGNKNKKLKYAVTKRSTGRVELIKEILMGAHDTTELLIEY